MFLEFSSHVNHEKKITVLIGFSLLISASELLFIGYDKLTILLTLVVQEDNPSKATHI